jgi:protein-S-isoprenylcysteine O-methyltransferase Ste14
MRRVSGRQLLTYAAALGVLAIARPIWPTYAIGCVVAALGLGLRVWACGHLRKNRELVTSGPYAHVQHPLYLGTFLIALGAIIAAGSPQMPSLLIWAAGGPLFLIAFFVYYLPKKKRVEGSRLAEKFEGFSAFSHAVPAFMPSLRRYPAASRHNWSAATFRANHELGMDVLVTAVFAVMILVPRVVPWA